MAPLNAVRATFDAAYSGDTISRALSVLISLPNFSRYAQRLHLRQLRIANPVLDRMPVPLFALHRQQRFQIANVALILFRGLFGSVRKLAPMTGTRTALQYCRTLA